MRKVKKFLFWLHRISGMIICLFFFMWFVSGLVLVYHSFPNVSKAQKYHKKEVLPTSLPDLQSVLARIPESISEIQDVNIKSFQKQVLFSVKTKDSTYTLCADSNEILKAVTFEGIQEISKKWVDAPVLKIDTLYKRDQWIMYSRYKDEMPIYKFYFNNKEKHQLYISSITGEVQQFTNADQRFWAWMGAIPHKFYLPFIRENTDIWIRTLTIAGTIALMAALSGMGVGIYTLYKRYKNTKKLESPYCKRWYKWHHISGLIFGIFLITWGFSGAMSMQRIPQWIINMNSSNASCTSNGEYNVKPSKIRGKRLPITSYILDYRLIKELYPDVKEIEWSYFQDIPIYNVIVGNKAICIDASTENVKELFLPQSQIEKSIRQAYGEDTPFKATIIDEYDEYYLSFGGNGEINFNLAGNEKLPLPVYKVEVDNFDENRFYINPSTGDFKNLNKSRKAKKWIFNSLHYLQIKWLYERPVLWITIMWILCIGGSIVSFTGIYLSIKYIFRKICKRKKK